MDDNSEADCPSRDRAWQCGTAGGLQGWWEGEWEGYSPKCLSMGLTQRVPCRNKEAGEEISAVALPVCPDVPPMETPEPMR